MGGDAPTSDTDRTTCGGTASDPSDGSPLDSTAAVASVLAVAAAAYFVGLGAFGLLDNNEGIYAEIPRQMLDRGDWITPHYDGVMYLEKPPLLYWLIALAYRAFGVGESAARSVPAVAALGAAAVVVAWTRRVLSPRHGVVAGIVLLTSVGMLVMGRTVLFDVLLTFWITAALACLHLALVTGERRWSALAGAALAGGVLTKGLVALALPVGVLVAWAAIAGDWKALRRLRVVLLGVVFLAVAAPWHVAASLATKEFPWFYFVNEHVNRFLGTREPADYRTGPPWFYVPQVLLLAFPWTFLVPASLVAGWKALRDDRRAGAAGAGPSAAAFAFLGFAVPFLFFSISKAKATYYTIVVAPPLAVLGAVALLSPRATDGVPTPRALWTVPVLLQTGAVFAAAALLPTLAGIVGEAWPAVAVLVAACAAFAATLLVRRLRRPVPLAATACVFAWAVVWAWICVGPVFESELSSRPLAAAVRDAARPDESVVVKGRIERFSALPFYVERRVVELDGGDGDLEWGKRWEGGSDFFVTAKSLPDWRRRHPSWLVAGDEKALPWLVAHLPGARLERLWYARGRDGYRALWRVTSR